MNFSRSREKICEKTWASIFSKVGSKENWKNTEEKVGLRQAEIFMYGGMRL
jgi:hypothetical protein